jgi:hypothetical protein
VRIDTLQNIFAKIEHYLLISNTIRGLQMDFQKNATTDNQEVKIAKALFDVKFS